jgi:hypothetical protein
MKIRSLIEYLDGKYPKGTSDDIEVTLSGDSPSIPAWVFESDAQYDELWNFLKLPVETEPVEEVPVKEESVEEIAAPKKSGLHRTKTAVYMTRGDCYCVEENYGHGFELTPYGWQVVDRIFKCDKNDPAPIDTFRKHYSELKEKLSELQIELIEKIFAEPDLESMRKKLEKENPCDMCTLSFAECQACIGYG